MKTTKKAMSDIFWSTFIIVAVVFFIVESIQWLVLIALSIVIAAVQILYLTELHLKIMCFEKKEKIQMDLNESFVKALEEDIQKRQKDLDIHT